VQIPKAQKDTDELTFFFALLGSAPVKAACKHVGEIDPRYHNLHALVFAIL